MGRLRQFPDVIQIRVSGPVSILQEKSVNIAGGLKRETWLECLARNNVQLRKTENVCVKSAGKSNMADAMLTQTIGFFLTKYRRISLNRISVKLYEKETRPGTRRRNANRVNQVMGPPPPRTLKTSTTGSRRAEVNEESEMPPPPPPVAVRSGFVPMRRGDNPPGPPFQNPRIYRSRPGDGFSQDNAPSAHGCLPKQEWNSVLDEDNASFCSVTSTLHSEYNLRIEGIRVEEVKSGMQRALDRLSNGFLLRVRHQYRTLHASNEWHKIVQRCPMICYMVGEMCQQAGD